MGEIGHSIERAIGVTTYGSAVLRTEPDIAVTWQGGEGASLAFDAVRDATKAVGDVWSKAGIDRSDTEASQVWIRPRSSIRGTSWSATGGHRVPCLTARTPSGGSRGGRCRRPLHQRLGSWPMVGIPRAPVRSDD